MLAVLLLLGVSPLRVLSFSAGLGGGTPCEGNSAFWFAVLPRLLSIHPKFCSFLNTPGLSPPFCPSPHPPSCPSECFPSWQTSAHTAAQRKRSHPARLRPPGTFLITIRARSCAKHFLCISLFIPSMILAQGGSVTSRRSPGKPVLVQRFTEA